MPEIDLKSAIESNVIKLGTMQMEAHADRIIVIQDEFISGYECQICEGACEVKCVECHGVGSIARNRNSDAEKNPVAYSSVSIKCSACEGKGLTVCPGCNGKGGLLVMPEVSERRPTTGTIASVGEAIDCWWCKGMGTIGSGKEDNPKRACDRCKGTGGTQTFQRGQAVIYPSFAGHVFELTAEDIHGREVNITLVILRESEVLAKVSGHLELRRQKKSTAVGTAA